MELDADEPENFKARRTGFFGQPTWVGRGGGRQIFGCEDSLWRRDLSNVGPFGAKANLKQAHEVCVFVCLGVWSSCGFLMLVRVSLGSKGRSIVPRSFVGGVLLLGTPGNKLPWPLEVWCLFQVSLNANRGIALNSVVLNMNDILRSLHGPFYGRSKHGSIIIS